MHGHGQAKLEKGYYAYTGSALGDGSVSLQGRVARHYQGTKKKRWHIDYLLTHKKAGIIATVAASSNDNRECEVNNLLKSIEGVTVPIMGFGASDCRHHCGSHLLYLGQNPRLDEVADIYKRLFADIYLQPVVHDTNLDR